MGTSQFSLRWLLGVKSPSEEVRKQANKLIVKPFKKGLKQGKKDFEKYKAVRKKFERKWLKQNQSWADTRQKKKALEKAFLKKYPQWSFHIQAERIRRKWMKN